MLRSIIFTVVLICASVVICQKSANSIKTWLAFDRKVNGSSLWNTFYQFLDENFAFGSSSTLRVCNGFDSFILDGSQILACGHDLVEIPLNWSQVEFNEKMAVSDVIKQDPSFATTTYIVLVIVKHAQQCVFMDPLVALAKEFKVKKVFVLRDETGIKKPESSLRGTFSGLSEGKLTNQEEFFDDLCDYIMNEVRCRAMPNDEIKCQINTSALALRWCDKGIVACKENKCNCDEMYPWPTKQTQCYIKYNWQCPGGYYLLTRSVPNGSHCIASDEVFTKFCDQCPPSTPTPMPTSSTTEELPDLVGPDEDDDDERYRVKFPDIDDQPEDFTPIDIHEVLLRLSIANLVVLIIGLIIVVVVVACLRQKSPHTVSQSGYGVENAPFVYTNPNQLPIPAKNVFTQECNKIGSTSFSKSSPIGGGSPSSQSS